jgi:hypothetical protein
MYPARQFKLRAKINADTPVEERNARCDQFAASKGSKGFSVTAARLALRKVIVISGHSNHSEAASCRTVFVKQNVATLDSV